VSLHPEVYLPSQFIRVAGHVSRAMYFIQRGRVQLIERIVDEGDERTAGREFSAAGVKDSTFKIKECDLYFDMVSLFVATPNFSIRSLTHTDCFRCMDGIYSFGPIDADLTFMFSFHIFILLLG